MHALALTINAGFNRSRDLSLLQRNCNRISPNLVHNFHKSEMQLLPYELNSNLPAAAGSVKQRVDLLVVAGRATKRTAA